MLNLVGGGIDVDKDTGIPETPREALHREGDEEIENLSSHITRPVELFPVNGIITPKSGGEMMAHWTVFHARLLVPSSELRIGRDSEITAIAALTLEECFDHPNMSDLAKDAGRHFLEHELAQADSINRVAA